MCAKEDGKHVSALLVSCELNGTLASVLGYET